MKDNMTRPHIVRADTLDLQDQDSPSAQDHRHPVPLGGSPVAPHQQSSLRHVQEERNAEQEYLADAWGSHQTSERTSHEGSELLEEDTGLYIDSSGQHDPHGLENGMPQHGTEDGEVESETEDGVDDDMMDKVSSSPSIDDEDIDFEFVYALHTFVATIEGQANASKGDTMVLLDDSNSYWWLVRIVKDSSIGYLPAEHIETPTERLARLNKHRNIDLSASMLGDNPEKSKNPLKKAMRRRNAKMVTFTTPTFFEPEDIDWSEVENEKDDSDEIDLDIRDNRKTNEVSTDSSTGVASATSDGQVSDLEPAQAQREPHNVNGIESLATATQAASVDVDDLSTQENASKTSRNGTIRNTDSFFKDDKAEPRKISLTPNLLRDDSNSSTRSDEPKEKLVATQDIFDSLDKSNSGSVVDSSKEDKKKKDKKPGMLSGLFKKKDKKLKVDEVAGAGSRKDDGTLSPLRSPNLSGPTSPTGQMSPKRVASNGKLSKAPPSTFNAPTAGGAGSSPKSPTESAFGESNENPASVATNDLAKLVDSKPDAGVAEQNPSSAQSSSVRAAPPEKVKKEGGILAPLTNILSQNSSSSEPQVKREKLKEAKQRTPLDIDSSPEISQADENPFADSTEASQERRPGTELSFPPPVRPAPSVQPSYASTVVEEYYTPLEAPPSLQPPGLAVDTTAQNARSNSPPSPQTPTQNSAILDNDTEPKSSMEASSHSTADSPNTPTTSSSSATTVGPTTPQAMSTSSSFARRTWDDHSLRLYLDSNSNADVKDLLLLVHDKSEVVPVQPDHPLMAEMGFQSHQKTLDEMNLQLDKLLGGFMQRRL